MSAVERALKMLLALLLLVVNVIDCQQNEATAGSQLRLFQPTEGGSQAAETAPKQSESRADGARSLRSSYYTSAPNERIFDLGLLGRPYYGKGGNYPGGGYYPQTGFYPQGGYYPQSGGFYPNAYPGSSGYFPGTNSIDGSRPYGGVGIGGYNPYGGGFGGYGGYGGYGGNGGLQSYLGYNNGNYFGNRNLGYGYYSGTTPVGVTSSSLVSGYRGYN